MSIEGRLSLLGEGLARVLRAAAPESLRRFAAQCARLTVKEVGLDEAAVNEALALADRIARGDDAAPDRIRLAREAVAAEVRRLDAEAFRIHERAAEEDAFETEAFRAQYGDAFNRARAANAAMTALLDDSREAAAETAYEAAAGVGVDEARLLTLASQCGCAVPVAT